MNYLKNTPVSHIRWKYTRIQSHLRFPMCKNLFSLLNFFFNFPNFSLMFNFLCICKNTKSAYIPFVQKFIWFIIFIFLILFICKDTYSSLFYYCLFLIHFFPSSLFLIFILYLYLSLFFILFIQWWLVPETSTLLPNKQKGKKNNIL